MRSREVKQKFPKTDPRILSMIEQFNYSPQTIGYSELTKLLEAFALDYYHQGLLDADNCVIVDGNPVVAKEKILELRKKSMPK
ncbi:MAG TPA: hypothetical protein VLK33_01170 [Terriglobales bacterium]|nr:hypothetical protein [Terriglobales bacterium]